MLIHIPREQNEKVDLLSKLASTQKGSFNRIVIQETLSRPTIKVVEVFCVVRQLSWMDPIINFLQNDQEAKYAIKEVHEGVCGMHIGGRALTSKITRVGYYLSTLKKYWLAFVKNVTNANAMQTCTKLPRSHFIQFYRLGLSTCGVSTS
ncbi:hypothetical protein CR513_13116, partial [Mucuna pruriens]